MDFMYIIAAFGAIAAIVFAILYMQLKNRLGSYQTEIDTSQQRYEDLKQKARKLKEHVVNLETRIEQEHDGKKTLANTLKHLNAAFNNINDVILVLSPNEKQCLANQAFFDTTGYSPESLQSPDHPVFVRDDRGYLSSEVWMAVTAKKHFEGVTSIRQANGNRIRMQVKISTIDTSDPNSPIIITQQEIKRDNNGVQIANNNAANDATPMPPAFLSPTLLARRVNEDLQHIDKRRKAGEKIQRLILIRVSFNNLKETEQELGFEASDALLAEASIRLRTVMRGRDYIGRMSVDQLAVVYHRVSNELLPDELAHRIRNILQEEFEIGAFKIPLSNTIDVAVYPDDAQRMIDMFKKNDNLAIV